MSDATGLSSIASTHDDATLLTELQHLHGRGPCIDVAEGTDVVEARDLHTDMRWPQFQRDVLAGTAIRSVTSYRLHTTRHGASMVTLCATEADALTRHTRDGGLVFATYCAVLWQGAHREEHLRVAIASRDIIGQAKGMIMERYHINDAQAFDLLRELSQTSNVRLTDLARQLVNHDTPPSPPSALPTQ
ncbi:MULTISPECIES: ANTAR domain-containing protein [Actinomycetes]|uniref:ANTAR domain-containing protein n=1 Tax=Actinomycetes TaxID=1760 RepID=UPI00068AE225|nr:MULTISPECIES: ANTAR domain-containing protein [Actinomycetes]